jgi:hypothetical protein
MVEAALWPLGSMYWLDLIGLIFILISELVMAVI